MTTNVIPSEQGTIPTGKEMNTITTTVENIKVTSNLIPQQLIDAGARFIKVLHHNKAAFETAWEQHTFSHNDPELCNWLYHDGNYGVVSHNGIGTIDIDDMDIYKALGLEIPDSYSDCREGCRFHVFYKCADIPDEIKATKIATKFGDIRTPGHNSYVVGTGCIAENKIKQLKKYEMSNPSPVQNIEWPVLKVIIEKSRKDVKVDDAGVVIVDKPEPLKMTDKMHHQDIRRYVGNQVRLNVPLVAIRSAVIAMNKQGLFDRIRGDIELSTEIDGAWGWHMRAKEKRDTDKEAKANQTPEEKADAAEPAVTEVKVSGWFVKYLDGNYVYNITEKKWHVWNGICWAIDEKNTINTMATTFVETLFKSKNGLTIDEVIDYQRELIKLNTKTGINNIVTLASMQLIKVADDFDSNPHLLNLQNGTLVFTNDGFYIKDHEKSDMISFVGNCEYNPESAIPDIWLKHIDTITGNDKELACNMQEILGYCLDGGNPEERFLVIHGGGRNGKSVTMRVFMDVIGDYGLYVNPLAFMENANALYSPERLLMARKRMIVAQEPNKSVDEAAHRKDTTCIDASFIKTASGGDVVKNRKIHSNDIKEFKITGVITFCSNPLPKVTDDSIAFWERIITVPFPYIIPTWDRDPTIESKFKQLLPGILNWLLEGYMRKKGMKFKLCKAIIDDVAEYRDTVDEYAGFCHKCIDERLGGITKPNVLYEAYSEYQKNKRLLTVPKDIFLLNMGRRYNKKHTETGNIYTGIEIRKTQTTVTNT